MANSILSDYSGFLGLKNGIFYMMSTVYIYSPQVIWLL